MPGEVEIALRLRVFSNFTTRTDRGVTVIRAMLVALIIFLLATFPGTWLLMLFFGNLGVGLSYWGTLPLGIIVSALLGGASSSYVGP